MLHSLFLWVFRYPFLKQLERFLIPGLDTEPDVVAPRPFHLFEQVPIHGVGPCGDRPLHVFTQPLFYEHVAYGVHPVFIEGEGLIKEQELLRCPLGDHFLDLFHHVLR